MRLSTMTPQVPGYHGIPDNTVHNAIMGPIWDRQDPDGPHVGPMNIAIWDGNCTLYLNRLYTHWDLHKMAANILKWYFQRIFSNEFVLISSNLPLKYVGRNSALVHMMDWCQAQTTMRGTNNDRSIVIYMYMYIYIHIYIWRICCI